MYLLKFTGYIYKFSLYDNSNKNHYHELSQSQTFIGQFGWIQSTRWPRPDTNAEDRFPSTCFHGRHDCSFPPSVIRPHSTTKWSRDHDQRSPAVPAIRVFRSITWISAMYCKTFSNHMVKAGRLLSQQLHYNTMFTEETPLPSLQSFSRCILICVFTTHNNTNLNASHYGLLVAAIKQQYLYRNDIEIFFSTNISNYIFFTNV